MNLQSISQIKSAAPYYLILFNIPILLFIILMQGGWAIFLGIAYFVMSFGLSEQIFGENPENLDPLTDQESLFWFTFLTKIWAPLQFFTLYLMIYAFSHWEFSLIDKIGIMILMAINTSGTGIVIAHELIHRSSNFERSLGDWLLAMALYGHFRTEHIAGHHRYVATAEDPATARYNENLYQFLGRVLPLSFISAWRIEAERMKARNLPIWHYKNPFAIYFGLAFFHIALAYFIGGGIGVFWFFIQAMLAVYILETTNYIEHYGLCRKYLGNGKYEPVAPRHSWNSNYRVSNYHLINLQRHSDHHHKPSRRYPLLQAYQEVDAPQLPHGYGIMAFYAVNPRAWRRLMNPRVRRWRSMYYPEITDWTAYNQGNLPEINE